jgi:hypothetical protein
MVLRTPPRTYLPAKYRILLRGNFIVFLRAFSGDYVLNTLSSSNSRLFTYYSPLMLKRTDALLTGVRHTAHPGNAVSRVCVTVRRP